MEEVSPMSLSVRNVLVTLFDLALGAIILFLGLRFVFALFGVSLGVPFVAWVNSVSGSLTAPFAGILPSLPLGVGRLDITALLAILFYSLLFYLIRAIIDAVATTVGESGSYRRPVIQA